MGTAVYDMCIYYKVHRQGLYIQMYIGTYVICMDRYYYYYIIVHDRGR